MIQNIKHLCYVLKSDINTIENIIDNIDSYYLSWEKVKRDKETNLPVIINGKPKIRQLNTSKYQLKIIQKRIYKFLLSNAKIPEYAFGGVLKRDNVANANFHKGNKFFFTTDLKSFFPSISHSDVFKLFLELGFSPTISRVLTKLTTYKYQLPQGVPTSTLIANLIFKKTGDKLLEFASLNQLKFSTFVDDITFSSKIDFKEKVPEILGIIISNGYVISHRKTYYKTKNPIITGVVCQNNKLKLEQTFYKRMSRLKSFTSVKDFDEKKAKRYEGLLRYRQKVELSR